MRVGTTTGHVGESTEVLIGEAMHHLGVIFHTRFEVVRQEAELSAESAEFIPGTRDIARNYNAEAIKHGLGGVGAGVRLVVTSLSSLFIFPSASVCRGVDSPRDFHWRSDTKRGVRRICRLSFRQFLGERVDHVLRREEDLRDHFEVPFFVHVRGDINFHKFHRVLGRRRIIFRQLFQG